MRKLKTLFDQQQTLLVPSQPQEPKIKVGNSPIEIALGIDEQGRTTARKLYGFLELNQSNYSKWCKRNITENDFAEENVDYFYSSSMTSERGRGNFAEDYILVATFAKKLAMTSNSVRGEQAREYFIRVEEQLKRAVTAIRATEDATQPMQITQQVYHITLDEIVLLSKEQAKVRYNMGDTKLRSMANDAGALVYIGSKVLYHRATLDKYFEKFRA